MQHKHISHTIYAFWVSLILWVSVMSWSDYTYAQDTEVPLTSTTECTQAEQQAWWWYGQCNSFVKEDGVCKCDFNGTLYDLQNASTAEMLSLILRFIYILMWPLMAIGWYAMDNALVYGEIFHMDIALYQFWNMIKNLANYFVAFFFIWKILKWVTIPWWDLISSIPWLLKKTIVAAVGIQISRWVIGALLDLSTILTYGVWSMPLAVIQGNANIDQPILATHTSYKLSDMSDSSKNQDETLIYYSYGNQNYIQCSFVKRTVSPTAWNNTGSIWSFAPKSDAQGMIGRDTYFSGKVTNIVAWFNTVQNQINQNTSVSRETFTQDYCVDNGKLLKYHEPTETIGELSMDLNNINVYKAVYIEGIDHLNTIYDQKSNTTICGTEWVKCKTLSNIIEAWKGMTWPLYTLYGSILNFGNLAISTDNKTVYSLTLEFIIKAVFSIALVLPLVFICVMLIARALLMRVLIAFSPFLAVFYAFWKDDGGIGSKIDKQTEKIFSKWAFSGALSLIFMPVISVMALSIGIAFMHIMSSMMLQEPQDFLTWFGIEKTWQWCHSMPGVFTVCGAPNQVGDDGFSIFTNHFNRFVINLLAIGIMRSIMMAILKSVGIFSDMINKVTSLTTSILKSAPIIPLPSGATSISWLQKGVDNVSSYYDNEIRTYDEEKAKEIVNKMGYKTDEHGNIINNKDADNTSSTQSVIDNKSSLDKKLDPQSKSYQIAKNNTNTDYTQTANIHKSLQTMGSNIDTILDEIHDTKEWAQTIEKMAQWYEKWTNTKLARNENGLVDHKGLATWLKSPEFGTKLAESMYQQSYSKSDIDGLLKTFGNTTDNTNTTISLQDKFWSDKTSELNTRYHKHLKKEGWLAPIISCDVWWHKYLYEKGTHNAQDIVITNTQFASDKINTIDNIYRFKNSNNIAEFSWESTVSITSQQDLQSSADLVADLLQINPTLDETYFASGKVLYPFRNPNTKNIIIQLAKKTPGTITTDNNTKYTLSYPNNKAVFTKA